MASSSAARTNLDSEVVVINKNRVLGYGAFRVAFAGTYIGGNRNMQDAVCKRFLDEYAGLEDEFFSQDFHIADKAIDLAEDWNAMCELGKEILITRGSVKKLGDGHLYMVEPLIRYFTKYTSNNGWINYSGVTKWQRELLEAFSHYTYHRSGGFLIVCDLQGRYRYNRYSRNKCRFELTDPAICSRNRGFGPTDLGEKGIETFFANHKCSKFCNYDGYWAKPRCNRRWFEPSRGTSMLRSSMANLLTTRNAATFTAKLEPVYDDDEGNDTDSDDSW